MENKSKIYIAGHTGLVGSAIVRKLKEKGYNNLITREYPPFDLMRQGDVEDLFSKERPEYVFLAAARVGGILANNTYKADFIYDNLAIAMNVIHSAYKFGVKKLLNLGSSCIYPKLAPQPLKEEYLLSGYLESTNEPYAIAKISAIKLCRYFNEQYGTNFISIMPTNLYGPYDNFNLETAHVLPSLIRKFYLAKLLNEKKYNLVVKDVHIYRLGFGLDDFVKENDVKKIIDALQKIGITDTAVYLWGTGSPYREFLFVDDLTDAAVFLMERYDYRDIGELINVGSGVDNTIRDIARMVKDIVGFAGDIKYDPSKPDGTPRKLLDVSRLMKLDWKPSVSLAEGIRRSLEWYSSRVQ
ncbi:MAG: GDP-L-fucose synthase [Ignavibacteriales bacterium]|nr:GDP-L-fucose synthase [Ignavibacteriales bacterium]